MRNWRGETTTDTTTKLIAQFTKSYALFSFSHHSQSTTCAIYFVCICAWYCRIFRLQDSHTYNYHELTTTRREKKIKKQEEEEGEYVDK